MTIALLLASALAAEDIVVEVGPPVDLEQGGAWSRVLPRGDGAWSLAFATQDGLFTAPLETDGAPGGWTLDRDARAALTDRAGLKDHAITRCPDGTWLHAASANLDQPNDSAYGFVADADLQPVATGVLAERDASRAHNDLPIVCGADFRGTAFALAAGGPRNTFVRIGDDGAAAGEVTLASDPRTNGSGFLVDGGRLLHIGYGNEADIAWISTYDADFQLLGQARVPLVEAPWQGLWPQGFARIGDLYAVVLMALDTAGGGTMAAGGEIFLVLLDETFQVVARHQLTAFGAQRAAWRPWLARQGDTLLVSYDHDNRAHVQQITLDLDGAGVADDTGPGGGDDAADAGDAADEDDDAKDDGCATAPALPGLAWLVGLLAVARRRA